MYYSTSGNLAKLRTGKLLSAAMRKESILPTELLPHQGAQSRVNMETENDPTQTRDVKFLTVPQLNMILRSQMVFDTEDPQDIAIALEIARRLKIPGDILQDAMEKDMQAIQGRYTWKQENSARSR